MIARLAVLAPLILAVTAACPSRELSEVVIERNTEQGHRIPIYVRPKIDVLFVIDDSGSMREEQESLAEHFDRFMEVLENVEGGLLDLHIGVVSTDVGAGTEPVDTCRGDGEDGVLQRQARGDCTPPDGAFLLDEVLPDGTRRRNYPEGQLAESFACIARLGTRGCGFEQPLEAMRRALDDHPSNQGFLRDDAFLAVIFITDEDDCSAVDPRLFDAAGGSLDTELGPLHSFRCFEFGVECDPDDPRSPGEKRDCRPRTGSPYLRDVQDYVDFLEGLKDDPGQIIVAGIIGDAEPVRVAIEAGESGGEVATLEPSCSSAAGEAMPPVRLRAFLESFPGRHTITAICNDDLTGALVQIAQAIALPLPLFCIHGPLVDTDPAAAGIQPECTAVDVAPDGGETVLPACAADGPLPCYLVVPEELCNDTSTGLTVHVCRGQADDHDACPAGPAQPVAPRSTTVVRCLAK